MEMVERKSGLQFFYSSLKQIRENAKLFFDQIAKNPQEVIYRLCCKF